MQILNICDKFQLPLSYPLRALSTIYLFPIFHPAINSHYVLSKTHNATEIPRNSMAPPVGKRVKGCQIYRPFVYGTTARPFDEKTNPKPAGVPDDHTHSWCVFVKGIEDVDITYWLRRVQFKLHESIPNHVRSRPRSPRPSRPAPRQPHNLHTGY